MRVTNNADNEHRIKYTAQNLFNRYGVKSISIDDVTASLHISKKTFYKSFTNKEELVKDFARDQLRELKSRLSKVHYKYQGIERFLWIQYCYFTWLSNYNEALLRDFQKYYPTIIAEYKAFESEFILNELIDSIQGLKDNGHLIKKIDVKSFCQLQLSNMVDVFFGSLTYLKKLEPSDLFDQLIYNNLRGILNNQYATRFELENFRAELQA